MSEFSLTPYQKRAVEDRGGALLVSAAAGSGKTRVLTERLIERICDPAEHADINDFLVITFTKAAAAELRSRISDSLAERAAENPGAVWLRRQSVQARTARIGTIHSFCADLLKEHCSLLGLDTRFSVADEDKARLLKQASLRRTLDRAYEKADPDFRALADSVGAGKDDMRLEGLVESLHDKLQCHARPEEWIRDRIEDLENAPSSGDAGETDAGRVLLNGARETAVCWADSFSRILSLLRAENPDIVKAYGESFQASLDALRKFADACLKGWDEARTLLPIPFPRLRPLRKPEDPDTAEKVKAVRDDCKKAAEKLADVFSEGSAKLLSDAAATVPAMKALLRLILDFDSDFAAAKKRGSLVDFSDLEHLAAKLLTNPDGSPTQTARSVSSRFTEVMVDEYQDISRVQELIIKAVSDGGRKLFMVGDVKQSIYRFRLADPTIFIEKYLSYAPAETASGNEPRRVLLRENFRSRPALLSGVNSVFGNLMSRSLGDLDYDDNAALRPGLPDTGGSPVPELILLSSPVADDEDRPDKTAAEAGYVAQRILNLVSSGETVREGGADRPVSFGDIAILLRSANIVGGIYKRELMKAGIPVVNTRSGSFFDSPEVSVMLSFLSVIDNPRQDVPLIAVLRSELFGFTPDELSAVRVRDKEGDFFTALRASADNIKCAAFLETLDRLRRYAADSRPGELLTEIYNSLDCMALCCAAPDGAARRENLSFLCELARKYASVSATRSLRGFLSWVQSMAARGEEPGIGTAAAGGCVRIMSTHKSKGLEFPVVFLSDTARSFNKKDLSENVLVHPSMGLGPKITDTVRGIEYPTLPRRGIAAKLDRDALSEELRLLYVAMTRARDRLFITASVSKPDDLKNKIARSVTVPMDPCILASMQNPASWLISAALADEETSAKSGLPRNFLMSFAEPAGETALTVPTGSADAEAEPCLGENIAAKLDWKYACENAVSVPSKVTATELKRAFEDDPEAANILPQKKTLFRKPDLSPKDGKPGGAELGIAVHKILRHIDAGRCWNVPELRAETRRLASEGYLSESEAEYVDIFSLARFTSSDIWKRIGKADAVWREFPFSLLRPAGDYFPVSTEDSVLLNGVVDCCFEENGELVIIDYKTDNVYGGEVEQRAKYYYPQIRMYAEAMSAVTGKRVKESLLCFLKSGEIVQMDIHSKNA